MTVDLAGMLMPAAKVPVANTSFTRPAECIMLSKVLHLSVRGTRAGIMYCRTNLDVVKCTYLDITADAWDWAGKRVIVLGMP